MIKKIFAYSQYFLPHHLITLICSWFTKSTNPSLKNFLILQFIKHYQVNMQEALLENPLHYPSFNDFFIRKLKPSLRPISTDKNDIVSPIDGITAQFGAIKNRLLIQAKGFYFDLRSLCGGDNEIASYFNEGNYATFYLAPRNYHRVHMPLTGTLKKTVYIPGRLFSVNRISSETIPNLYSRNERLVSLFDTNAGKMAVILVGALIVGNIKTVWLDEPVRNSKIQSQNFSSGIELEKGAELGYFSIGSTVILLFADKRIDWVSNLVPYEEVKMGQPIGKIR